MIDKKTEKILQFVEKPGRYVGGEINSICKDKSKIDLRYAFCFPDTYEIGMSHLGMKIIYGLVNEREDAWCERVFAPGIDMEEQLRKNNIPLYALESGDPISDFDLIGFTLQYELSYTNMLNMLDMAKIPLFSNQRKDLTPLVCVGGPCACNPEPIADFCDIVFLGDGEISTNKVLDKLKIAKAKKLSKNEFLESILDIEGVYVPSFYDVEYNEDNTINSVNPIGKAPIKPQKSVVSDLNKVYYPDKFVVPLIEIVHDRAVEEIFRGCIRGCRFCQAGFIYRPIREKDVDTINKQARLLIDNTGYDEISLCSLSTSDYSDCDQMLSSLIDWTLEYKVNLSLPSLRVDNFSDELVEKLNKVRKTGLTFAPEAGTQRLRDVINKNITENNVLDTCHKAFESGWSRVKLYFMMGLPTETDEDLKGISSLGQKVVDEYYKCENRNKGKPISVSIPCASFIPKPFTPFQWEPESRPEELIDKQSVLLDSNNCKKVSISYHESKTSLLEGVLARGDRRLSKVIYDAFLSGCKFDSWDEHFDFNKWLDAFSKNEIDYEFYVFRQRSYEEIFPWDHLNYGIRKEFLINENKKAHNAQTTPHCRIKCSACGASVINGGHCDARD